MNPPHGPPIAMVSHLPAVQINLKFLRTIQIPTKYLDLLLKVLSKTKAFELPGIAVLTSCLEPQPHTVEHIPCWTLKAIEDYVRDVGYVGFVSHSSIFPVLSSTFFVGKKKMKYPDPALIIRASTLSLCNAGTPCHWAPQPCNRYVAHKSSPNWIYVPTTSHHEGDKWKSFHHHIRAL